MLEYIKGLSNQYYISEILYKEISKKNILDNYGKKQYRTSKEDNSYLKELYKAFDIDINKYELFMDICSNPNTHTLYILNQNKKINGVGISLQVDQGGYNESPLISNYKNRYHVQYFNLLKDDFNDIKLDKVDYVTGECFIRHNIESSSIKPTDLIQMNAKLQNKLLKLLSIKLKQNGDALILLPFHYDPIVFFNYIYIFKKMFNKIGIYKSEKYSPNLSIVYIHCINYTGEIDLDLLDKIDDILFDKQFVKENIKYLDYVYRNINIGTIKSIKES